MSSTRSPTGAPPTTRSLDHARSDENERTPPTAVAVMLAVLAQVAGFFIARMIIDGVEVDGATVVLVVAGPVGLALGILAITRFEWFVWIVLAIRPTLDAFGGTGMGPGAMLAAAFLAAASVWLVVQIRAGQSRPLSPTSRAMLLFAGAVLAAVLTSQLRSTSALAALEIFAGITMFLVLEQLLAERPDRVRRLVTAVLAGAAVPLAVGLTQWIVGDSVGTRTDIGRIKSTFAHPNPFATYLVLVILLGLATATALHGRRRWLVGAYVLALGTMLVATYNRSGWIAVIVGLLYLGIRRSRWIIAGFVVAATVAVLAIPSIMDRIADLGGGEDFAYVPSDVPDNSFEWRVQYWESLIPMANESPITGLGPQVVVNTRPEKLEPHNVFVQTYVEIGLLGIVSLGAVVVTIGVELSRRRRAAPDELGSALAVGAIAAALAILVMAPSENLLNQTMSWWYLAACTTWGYGYVVRSSSSAPPADEPVEGIVRT